MSVNSIHKQLILLTGVLVLFLGGYTYFDIMSWKPQGESRKESARAPASVLTLEHSVQGRHWKHPEMITWSLDCLDSGGSKTFNSNARQVRLTGRLCDMDRYGELTTVEVINKSNGFRGTSFHLGDNRFTSDYIYLVNGMNRIMVGLEGEQGQKLLTELVFNRRQAQ